MLLSVNVDTGAVSALRTDGILVRRDRVLVSAVMHDRKKVVSPEIRRTRNKNEISLCSGLNVIRIDKHELIAIRPLMLVDQAKGMAHPVKKIVAPPARDVEGLSATDFPDGKRLARTGGVLHYEIIRFRRAQNKMNVGKGVPIPGRLPKVTLMINRNGAIENVGDATLGPAIKGMRSS